MAHFEIKDAPVRETDDPFGLHDPLTLDDLLRIEEALKEGFVEGKEAERLRTIHDAETAKLRDAIAPALEAIYAPFKDIGSKAAASLARSVALPNHFAGLGKLNDQLAGLARTDEALKKSISGLLPRPVIPHASSMVEDLRPLPLMPPLDKAVINQGSTLGEIRTGIDELVAAVEAEHMLMTEQLRQSQEGALEERRRYEVNIRLALIGLLASNAISVIIAVLK